MSNVWKNVLIPFQYDEFKDFHEKCAKVKKGSLIGYVNTAGEEFVPCIYEDGSSFFNGYARVQQNGKWGFINESGQITVPPSYDSLGDYREGIAPAELSGKWGYINESGTPIVPFMYDAVGWFSSDRGCVKINGKAGFVDSSGALVIPYIYDGAGSYLFWSNGYALVMKNNRVGIIDRFGNETVPCKYKMIYEMYDGSSSPDLESNLLVVENNNKFGCVTFQGDVILPVKYDRIPNYTRDDLILIVQDGLYGISDLTGTLLIPPQFEYISSPYNGYMWVKQNDTYGIIDVSTLFSDAPERQEDGSPVFPATPSPAAN